MHSKENSHFLGNIVIYSCIIKVILLFSVGIVVDFETGAVVCLLCGCFVDDKRLFAIRRNEEAILNRLLEENNGFSVQWLDVDLPF